MAWELDLPACTNNSAASSIVNFLQVVRPTALQSVDRFLHFNRVADHSAQRLIHVREQRRSLHSASLASFDKRPRQSARLVAGLHECARTEFDIQDKGIKTLRQLFAHDAGGVIKGIDATVPVTSRSA